jgi:methionyl-tRNA synthetase
LREVTFGQDGSFSYDALVQRYNADLANGLGNLASRTLTMIHQYRGGVDSGFGRASDIAEARTRPPKYALEAFDDFNFSKGLEASGA